MAIRYPGGIDNFNEPSLPESTPLSEAGTGSRNHVEHHHDLGSAITALQQNAAFYNHDHSGDGSTAHGNRLSQANTHQNPDTDTSSSSLHHTLAARNAADLGLTDLDVPVGGWKAAAFNHTHDYNGLSILNQPLRLCTSSSRPANPNIGTMIYETDTNVVRVYAKVDSGGLAPASSNATPVWQILPIGKVPTFYAETRTVQEMVRQVNNKCKFTHNLQDFYYSAFGIARFMEITQNDTRITIPEPGFYDVRSTIHWHPDETWHDQSLLTILVNNTDIGKKNWKFTRAPILPWGPASKPGFPQTQELAFSWRFQAGDTLDVVVRHNANRSSFLWWNNGNPSAGDKQVCSVEVNFRTA